MTTAAILNPKKTFTADERKRIAAGWRGSGLGQAEYAAQHGIRPRTLRLWLRDVPVMASPDDVRATGQQVLEALRRAAALLEEALRQADAGGRAEPHAPRSAEVSTATPVAVPSLKKFSFD